MTKVRSSRGRKRAVVRKPRQAAAAEQPSDNTDTVRKSIKEGAIDYDKVWRQAEEAKAPKLERGVAADRQPATVINPWASIKTIADLHPPGVAPKPEMAMDDAAFFGAGGGVYPWAANAAIASQFLEGIGFLGYTYLSELAQRSEYRVISETLADEMTRKSIRLKGSEDAGKDGAKTETSKLKELDLFLRDIGMMEHLRKDIELDGFMGRSHLYIDTGATDDPGELQTSIGNGRDDASRAKIGKGDFKALRPIEPVWCYPADYNSNDPMQDNWYNPHAWFVLGKKCHHTRLLTFVGREVPDMLKPSYSFGGLSLSQMAKPYVDNWLTTRQSVADLVRSFTVFALGTNLFATMERGGGQVTKRVQLFNNFRSNSGTFLYDKNTEEFSNVSAGLGGLHELQSQAQEHLCAVARTPAVKLLGVQPQGFNASSEGELQSYGDTISGYRERFLRKPITTILGFAQLSLWGEIDDTITFDFEPIKEMDTEAIKRIEKLAAETAQIRIDTGIISQAEERQRLANDPDSPYHDLDPDDLPDLEEEEQGGLIPKGGGGGLKSTIGEQDDVDVDEEGEPAKDAQDPALAEPDGIQQANSSCK